MLPGSAPAGAAWFEGAVSVASPGRNRAIATAATASRPAPPSARVADETGLFEGDGSVIGADHYAKKANVKSGVAQRSC